MRFLIFGSLKIDKPALAGFLVEFNLLKMKWPKNMFLRGDTAFGQKKKRREKFDGLANLFAFWSDLAYLFEFTPVGANSLISLWAS